MTNYIFRKLDRLENFCAICLNFNLSWERFHFPLRIFAINFLRSYFFFIDRDLFHCLVAKLEIFLCWIVWVENLRCVVEVWRICWKSLEDEHWAAFIFWRPRVFLWHEAMEEREGGCYGCSEPIKIASSFFNWQFSNVPKQGKDPAFAILQIWSNIAKEVKNYASFFWNLFLI